MLAKVPYLMAASFLVGEFALRRALIASRAHCKAGHYCQQQPDDAGIAACYIQIATVNHNHS